jgi:hypothetical protein
MIGQQDSKYLNIKKTYNAWKGGELEAKIQQEIVKIEECQKILNGYTTLVRDTQSFLYKLNTFFKDFFKGKIKKDHKLYEYLSNYDQRSANNERPGFLSEMTPSLLQQLLLLTNHTTNSVLNNYLSTMPAYVSRANFSMADGIRKLLQKEIVKCVSDLGHANMEANKKLDSQGIATIDYTAFKLYNQKVFEFDQGWSVVLPERSICHFLKTRKNDLEEIDRGFKAIDNLLKKNNHKELNDEVINEAFQDPTVLERLCHWLVETFGLGWQTNIKLRTSFTKLLNKQEDKIPNMGFLEQ